MIDMPLLDAVPARFLHVTTGTGPGNGSVERPFHSIQDAVNAATPGTAILVHDGTYKENIKIPSNRSGSVGQPIWLVSADGPQAATIVAATNSAPVIQALGVDNYLIKNFEIKGGYDGIQFSQSGRDFSNLVNNVVIDGNVVDSAAHDGIKIGQATNVIVSDNRIRNIASEEGIDFVAVDNGVIARNEVYNVKGTSAAIFAKGGSTDIKIFENYVHDVTGDGISAGGNTSASSFRPGAAGYEAKNVSIAGNKIEDVGKRPVSVRGGENVDINNNYLEAAAKYGNAVYITTGSQNSAKQMASHDVRVTANVVANTRAVLKIDSGNDHSVTASGNATGIWKGLVGPSLVVDPLWTSAKPSAPPNTAPAPPQDPPAAPSPSSPGRTPTPPVGTGGLSPEHVPAPTEPPAVVASTARVSALAKHSIKGGGGQDHLVGTDGADRIDGLSREDTMSGRGGDDTYVASGYRDLVVEAHGGGIDTVELFDTRFFLGAEVENLVAKLSQATGLIGNELDNMLVGAAGNDILVGGKGQDILTGGQGDDTFVIGSGDGSDIITDLQSNDRILLSGAHFDSFQNLREALYRSGADTILDLMNGQSITLRDTNIEALTAQQFGYDHIQDGAVESAGWTNTVTGGTKQGDWMLGSSGDDLLDGKYGADVMAGAAGNDTYVVDNAQDRAIERAGQGTDTVLVDTNIYELGASIENAIVRYAPGAHVEGNDGANQLVGGTGADWLAGGPGRDILTGGKGNDTFAFLGSGDGADTIADFVHGQDKLDFRNLFAENPGGAITAVESPDGLQIYFDHGAQHDLIVTLLNVTTLLQNDYPV